MNPQFLKRPHPSIEAFLRDYVRHNKTIAYTPDHPHFFLDGGDDAYIGLQEFLQQYTNEDSPCFILDTRIHLVPLPDNPKVFVRQWHIYIAVLADDQHNDASKKIARDEIMLQWWYFYNYYLEVMRSNANNFRHILHGTSMSYQIDSTTTFLNGWEAIRITLTQPLQLPCVPLDNYLSM